MSDDDLALLLVLAAVYLLECIHWAPSAAWVFRAAWRPRLRRVPLRSRPDTILGSPCGLNPLPPLGWVVNVGVSPLSFSEDGVFLSPTVHLPMAHTTASAGTFFRWTGLPPVLSENARLVADTPRRKLAESGRLPVDARFPKGGIRFASARAAALAAEQWNERRSLTPSERREGIATILRHSLDLDAASAAWAQTRSLSAPIRVLSIVLWGVLFVATPLVMIRFGFSSSWGWLVGAAFALSLAIAVTMFRARTRQGIPRADRLAELFLLTLSPLSAARATDRIFSDSLARFHPATIALLMEGQSAGASVAALLRELHYPRYPDPLGGSPQASQFAALRDTERRAVRDFLSNHGFDPDQLLASAVKDLPPSTQSYCPRCLEPFQISPAHCPPCDRPTVPIGDSA